MTLRPKPFQPIKMLQIIGGVFFAYLFFGFMLLPCLNTLTSIFTVKNAAGETDPLAVIRFFLAGSMSQYVWNSLKLALCLVITVNVVGISIVLLTEYFDIKGAKILRLGYMTTLIYSGVALVTGYMFLYASDGIITTQLKDAFPNINVNWFTGFNAVLFTMTFACTSNHALFLRNAIRGIDYNTVEAARNMGAKPFKVLWKVVFPTLLPTLFSLTVMTFITGLCAMSAPTLLGYDSINPEIVRLAGSSVADEAFPQARAALLSIILACFTILLLTVLSSYERKGHYLSVSKTKAKLQKQKITNPVANVLAHIYAYVLFIIYMTPVVMIVIFSFQTFSAVRMRKLDLSQWTLVNYFGKQDYSYLTSRGTYKIREGSISGVFSNKATLGGIQMSFLMSVIAAALVSGNAILFSSRSQIKGLTTSTGLWACSILGFAIGAGLYTVTGIVFLFFLCILACFPAFEQYLKNRSNHFEIHLELKNSGYLRDFVTVSRRMGLRIDDIEANQAYAGSGLSVFTVTFTICSAELKKYKTHREIIEALSSLDYIYHIEEMR